MLHEHIFSQVCLDSLGPLSLLVSKLQPDVKTYGELAVAAAVKDTHSSNLLGMWNLFYNQISYYLLPYLIVKFVREVIRYVTTHF